MQNQQKQDLTLAAEGPIDLEPTDDDFEDEEEIVELDNCWFT